MIQLEFTMHRGFKILLKAPFIPSISLFFISKFIVVLLLFSKLRAPVTEENIIKFNKSIDHICVGIHFVEYIFFYLMMIKSIVSGIKNRFIFAKN